MAGILEQIQDEALKLIPVRSTVLVAVSGGLDSMVLATTLQQVAAVNRWKLIVAHFNHRLRRNASSADERLVERFSQNHDLPFHSAQWDKAADSIKAHGLEMAAREARYRFFKSVACEQRCRFIVTAHHADDQAETFLWRLMRGSGGKGLSGIQALTQLSARPKIQLARPLLLFSKADLKEVASHERIHFREDQSNRNPDQLRNKIRTQLLPYLQRHYHPKIQYPILQSQNLIAADADFAAQQAKEWLNDSFETHFNDLHLAVQRWVIWHQLIKLEIPPQYFLIEDLRSNPDQTFTLAPNRFIRRDGSGRIHITSPQSHSYNSNSTLITPKSKWEALELSSTKIQYRLTQRRPTSFKGEIFDADQAGPALTIRHWQPGDRFQPIGRNSPVKLKTLFINAKIPNAEKRSRILAVNEHGKILWVEGLRIGDAAKTCPQTQRYLLWKWSKI